jgi:hypothetical protein
MTGPSEVTVLKRAVLTHAKNRMGYIRSVTTVLAKTEQSKGQEKIPRTRLTSY